MLHDSRDYCTTPSPLRWSEIEDDHAFDFGTLDYFVMAIGNTYVYLVTRQSGGRHFTRSPACGLNHEILREYLIEQIAVMAFVRAVEHGDNPILGDCERNAKTSLF